MWNELKYEQSNERLNTCYFSFMVAEVLDSSNYFLKRCRIMQNPLYRRFPTVLCVLKKTYCICAHTHTRTRAQPHVESHWRQQRRSDDPRATSDFLVSPLCYICVTPTHQFRGERKKKKSLFRHMRNICLLESRWAPQRGRRRGRNKKKKRQRETKGGSSSSSSSSATFMSLAGPFLLAHPPPTCQVSSRNSCT